MPIICIRSNAAQISPSLTKTAHARPNLPWVTRQAEYPMAGIPAGRSLSRAYLYYLSYPIYPIQSNMDSILRDRDLSLLSYSIYQPGGATNGAAAALRPYMLNLRRLSAIPTCPLFVCSLTPYEFPHPLKKTTHAKPNLPWRTRQAEYPTGGMPDGRKLSYPSYDLGV